MSCAEGAQTPGYGSAYSPGDVIGIPEDVPEIGLKAGRRGLVDAVYPDDSTGGLVLLTDCSSPTPPSALVFVAVDPDGALRVAGHVPL